MKAFVVDVNVAIVANGHSRQADLACVSACVNALDEIVQRGMIVLDDGWQILAEYIRHLSPKGQPGLGDAFMQWVWEHQSIDDRCERVTLTPSRNAVDEFEEFPADSQLRDFDRSDRKYVAVALSSRKNPEVLNAVDPDWWQHKEVLLRNSVRLRFLCPQHM
jgi:hypothetical protein